MNGEIWKVFKDNNINNNNNKRGKVYCFEYTDIQKVFFTPQHVGRCCIYILSKVNVESWAILALSSQVMQIEHPSRNKGLLSRRLSTPKEQLKPCHVVWVLELEQWPPAMHVEFSRRKQWSTAMQVEYPLGTMTPDHAGWVSQWEECHAVMSVEYPVWKMTPGHGGWVAPRKEKRQTYTLTDP
jgi:hypothetical protein